MTEFQEIDCVKLGEKIRIQRVTQSLSREKLGELAGISGATIANIESSAEKALLKNIIAIAKALNVSVKELL